MLRVADGRAGRATGGRLHGLKSVPQWRVIESDATVAKEMRESR